MNAMPIILKKQAADAVVRKTIQHGVVTTSNIIDGKIGHTDHKDIKRLGYKSVPEYVAELKRQGYTEE